MSNTHTGHCYCGAVSMISTEPPRWVAHCHCADCRRATGAAFATYAGFASADVSIEGPYKRLCNSDKTSRGFCGECGTTISYEGAKWPDEIHICIGFLDEPEKYEPLAHVQMAEKMPWLAMGDDGAKQFHRFVGED